MVEETIQVTILSKCKDCDSEIKRKPKEYILKDFNFMARLNPNSYYTDAGTNEHFIVVKSSICEVCQT